MRADADVVILGGIGVKFDEYLKFRIAFEQAGVLSRTIMFIHTASDPVVVKRLLVPDMALAVAEQFGVMGKRVLVLLTNDGFCRCYERDCYFNGPGSFKPRLSGDHFTVTLRRAMRGS